MTTLIVDADGLAYQAAAAAQKGIAWDDEIYTVHADFAEAKRCLSNNVAALLTGSECDDLVLCWSKGPYFRKAVLPSYKANRKGSQPPLVFKDLRAWAFERWPSKEKPGLEADDVVGILATMKNRPDSRVIFSPDKDLLQIPGLHYRPGEGVYRVAEDFAFNQLWLQVLTGDKSDGYTGIPGCGPKKAAAILSKAVDRVIAVREAYLAAGLTLKDLEVQVNVARILQAHCYDFKRKEPILWQTP